MENDNKKEEMIPASKTFTFEAQCSNSKGRRLLRKKNHFRLEEFTLSAPLLKEGKKYKVTIEEIEEFSTIAEGCMMDIRYE